ncbi:MAG: TlpA disulfide reductase family protein [Acidimicrobiia bacterium]
MNRIRPMLRRSTATLLAVLALAVVVAAPAGAQGLDDERSPRIRVDGTKLKASDDIGTVADPAVGKTAPTLKGLSLAGKKITVGNDGKPRIVVFLSHSCPHCRAEVPRIVELAKQGKLDGVEVDTVATNTSQDLPNWPPSEWLRAEGWPYRPVLADDANLRALDAFGGDAFPYFVFVDADGKVAARVSGELEPSTLTEAATRLQSGQSLFE